MSSSRAVSRQEQHQETDISIFARDYSAASSSPSRSSGVAATRRHWPFPATSTSSPRISTPLFPVTSSGPDLALMEETQNAEGAEDDDDDSMTANEVSQKEDLDNRLSLLIVTLCHETPTDPARSPEEALQRELTMDVSQLIYCILDSPPSFPPQPLSSPEPHPLGSSPISADDPSIVELKDQIVSRQTAWMTHASGIHGLLIGEGRPSREEVLAARERLRGFLPTAAEGLVRNLEVADGGYQLRDVDEGGGLMGELNAAAVERFLERYEVLSEKLGRVGGGI